MDISSLVRPFFEIASSRNVPGDADSMPGNFSTTLSECIRSEGVMKAGSIDLRALSSEQSTWQLIDTLQWDGRIAEELESRPASTRPGSDAEIIQNLVAKNAPIRRLASIVDWLQQSAVETADHLYHACELRWASPEDFWKAIAPGGVYAGDLDKAGINSLDQLLDNCHKVSPQLAQDFELIYRAIFALLRCGDLGRAEQLCCRVGHYWLAAAIGGERLFECPSFEQITDSSANVGNMHRLLWQSVAYSWLDSPLKQQSANTNTALVYERAVFGILSGRLDCVLPVAVTWHDRLWACLHVFLTVQHTRALIRESSNGDFFLPDAFFTQIRDLADVLSIADTSSGSAIVHSASPMFERCQRCLILEGDRFDMLLEVLFDVSALIENDQSVSSNDLRFCVHLLVWLNAIGVSGSSNPGLRALLLAYVQELSTNPSNVDAAAFYCSQLLTNQVDAFVDFCDICLNRIRAGLKSMTVNGDEFVRQAIIEAKRVGFNIRQLVRELVERRFKQTDDLLHCLSWYSFAEAVSTDRRLLIDFICLSNSAIRMLLIAGKSDEARAIFINVRPSCIATIIAASSTLSLNAARSSFDEETSSVEMGRQPTCIREYLCYKAFFLALDALNDWNAASVADMNSTWSSMGESEQRKTLLRATEALVDNTLNVLLFIGPGWLVDDSVDVDNVSGGCNDEIDDSDFVTPDRADQLDRLRRHYIPELALSLAVCLTRTVNRPASSPSDINSSKRMSEVLEFKSKLFDAIMASVHPTRRIDSLFTKSQLESLVRLTSDSTVILLA